MRSNLIQPNLALPGGEDLPEIALDLLNACVYLKGQDRRYLYLNRHAARMLGRTPQEIIGKSDEELLPPEIVAACRALEDKVFATGETCRGEETTSDSDGRLHHFLSIRTLLRSADHQQYLLCCSSEITELKESELALKHSAQALLESQEEVRISEQRHRYLADNARDVVWVMKLDGTVSYVSPAVMTVRGLTQEEAMAQTLDQILTPDSQLVVMDYFRKLHESVQNGTLPEKFRGENEYWRKDGSTFWSEVMAYPILDDEGKIVEILGVTRDIDDRKRHELEVRRARDEAEQARKALEVANAELAKLASTDPLTGVWNRRQFESIVGSRISQARRHGESLSLIMFDLDHFKAVNDAHGHQCGDRVLTDVAEITRQHLRAGDELARWGGEEFLILLPHCDLAHAAEIAEKLRGLFAQHDFPLVTSVHASFGATQWDTIEQMDSWIDRTDRAVYKAKAAGRNVVRTG
ncbi:MAG: diguanylate cyclase [Burkholderiaceae bacterium]|nr:diguanylate cyclase [Burkholderiaceae bacterium]